MATQLQKRLVEELPKNGYKVERAMKAAGYSEVSARANNGRVMRQKGTLEELAKAGVDSGELLKEYRWIGKQRKDLTNKRIVTEKLLAATSPELDFRDKPVGGNTNLTQVNIYNEAERQESIQELEQELLGQVITQEEGSNETEQGQEEVLPTERGDEPSTEEKGAEEGE